MGANAGAGMSDKTCKTCKWWDHPDAVSLDDSPQHKHKPCGHPSMSQGGGRLDADGAHGMYAYYFGDYYTISTGPDFGCIHWEAKE